MIRVTPELHVWLLLLALTVVSVILAEEARWAAMAIIAMFLIAAAKAALVVSRYMEIGHASPHWRVLYRLWIGAVTLMLVAGHLLG